MQPKTICRKILGLLIIGCFLVPLFPEGPSAGGNPEASFKSLRPPDGEIRSLKLAWDKGVRLEHFTTADGSKVSPVQPLPLFSLVIDGRLYSSLEGKPRTGSEVELPEGISAHIEVIKEFSPGTKIRSVFRNASESKVRIENLVPLGEGAGRVYITAGMPNEPPHQLSRTLLFRPGKVPVGVVLPDNAWHLGFCDIEVADGCSLVALARRVKSEKAEVRRWAATLEPGGSVEYAVYIDCHTGPPGAAIPAATGGGREARPETGSAADTESWRRGLEMMFRERWLYDLEEFDDALFRRPDLAWIRRAYIMLLQFAWDHTYYDRAAQKYAYGETLFGWDSCLGGVDVYTIWPTWPRLGLDERNQWDMYRDLPGGLAELRGQVDSAHRHGKKYFISYNPWDESTRHEDHLSGMETMLRTLDADGIVLDTRGESSREFQQTADRVKPGIVMYSEGMAVPKDMPGIVAGRVHDALFMPPPLNLNKFIKPDFAIFRVLQLAEGPLHRESAVSFFNGYGVEINTMRPGRPDWIAEELRFLGMTTKILRENASVFCDPGWTPLIPTLEDGIYVNRWRAPDLIGVSSLSTQAAASSPAAAVPVRPSPPSARASRKVIYTILSLKPEGCKGPLIRVEKRTGFHYVSLWNHEELAIEEKGGLTYAPVDVKGFGRAWLGTRREGNVDCLAVLPEILDVSRDHDRLIVGLKPGSVLPARDDSAANAKPAAGPEGRIVITAGNPVYGAKAVEFDTAKRKVSLYETFGRYEDKFVVQLFDGTELIDERVIRVPLALPRRVTEVKKTAAAGTAPPGMVEIPAGAYEFSTAGNPDDANPVIPYPETREKRTVAVSRFFMDKYPVTNAEFEKFLRAAKYSPKDTSNFLKHWTAGRPPAGLENHPVVNVGFDDARAYAQWARKRLPTEIEWQYAAQGRDGRKYPWGNEMEPGRCNNKLNHTTPVDAYPSGASPFGVTDLVGNVWQMTDDLYDNGAYYYTIIRGGSFYAPETSVWYVKSGPLPVDRVQILLLVAPGLDRCSTVGFRCVKDAE